MKILELDIRAFGPFTDFRLDLSGGSEGLHFIYGRNEAGKTSTLRAIMNMLFGIPKNSPDGFLHPYAKMRAGATLLHSDGGRLSFLRRKGNKNTLLSESGEALDDNSLNRFLMGISEEIFEKVFGIDHEKLVSGGQEILKGGGDVGRSLFSAGLGAGGIKSLLDDIDKEARELFIPSGSNPSINAGLASYKESENRIRELALDTGEWAARNSELETALAELDELKKKAAALAKEKARLERIKPALAKIARRAQILDALDAHANTPALPDGFREERLQSLQSLRSAEETLDELGIEINDLAEAEKSIVIPREVLDRKAEIEELKNELSVYRENKKKRAGAADAAARLEREAERELEDIRPGGELADIARITPPADSRIRINELIAQRGELAPGIKNVEKAIFDIKKKLEAAEAARAELGPPVDPSRLESAIKNTLKSGDLEAARDKLKNELDAATQQLDIDLCSDPLWRGSPEQLETAPVPSLETIERFEKETGEIEAESAALEKDIESLEKEIADKQQKLAALVSDGDVPEREALAGARRRRDELWELVRKAWLEGGDADERAAGGDTPDDLPAAFEESVARADDTADRLLDNAELVAQCDELKSSVAGLERKLGERKEALAELKSAGERKQEEWAGTWAPAGLTPLPPREMRSWRMNFDGLRAAAAGARKMKKELEAAGSAIEAAGADIARALGELGRDVQPGLSLRETLVFAENVRDDIVSRGNEYEKLSDKIEEYRIELEKADRESERLAGEMSEWTEKWETEMKSAGLEARTEPAVAAAVLDAIAKINEKLHQARAHEDEVAAIDRYTKGYGEKLRAVVSAAAPHLEGQAPEAAVNTLAGAASKAAADEIKLAGIREQLAQKRQQVEKTNNSIAAARENLDRLCAVAGCSSQDELPEIERASDDCKELKKERDDIESDLVGLSGGGGLEGIIAEASGQDADELDAALEEVKKETAELDAERSQLEQRIGSLRNVIDAMDGSAEAAEEDERRKSLAAKIRNESEKYLTLRLAHIMLENQIREFREKNQGPMLKRAGEVFSRITLGSFSGLAADFGKDDRQILLGVRRGSGEKIDTSGMSDGTLDQLFLALRIAYLEKYLETGEPIPFIVDDILVQFDDDRALATIELLAELSAKVQVLFFTHHSRLKELAEKAGGADSIFFHTLP